MNQDTLKQTLDRQADLESPPPKRNASNQEVSMLSSYRLEDVDTSLGASDSDKILSRETSLSGGEGEGEAEEMGGVGVMISHVSSYSDQLDYTVKR